MRRSLLLPLLACAALAACDGSSATAPATVIAAPVQAASPRSVTLGQSFDIRVGETVTVAGEPLTVRFDAVPSDSRCPTGVSCIWSGNAEVVVTLTQTGSTAGTFTLNTHIDPRTATYLGYQVELIGLAPYPGSRPIRTSDYRATLVVRKL